jgi:c-di-GMP-related signal transduction protein
VRVLNLVRQNGEIRDIEAALKHDVAMSYKLLRYINSAGFGLSCEIQSFRHAVNMLGYDKLNRWLSLLLATASKDPMAPALMYTALLRGRLMELLAAGLVDPAEYDNLFITGAFSLLDTLLGVGMEQALDAMRLPDPICDALLGNGGRYQPFLELALSQRSATRASASPSRRHARTDSRPVQSRAATGTGIRRGDGVLGRAADGYWATAATLRGDDGKAPFYSPR